MSCQRYSSWVLQRQSIGECHRLRVGISSVGRHSSSLIRILDSHYVSRHHAEIEVSLDDQTVTIKDLNSVNGVFVNNVLHKSSTITLSSEDTIGIGVSTNCNEEEDELTLPIYNLKYMPITRAKNNANIAQRAIKRESDNIPSTSRAAPSASAKPNIEQPILIISDDEDEIDGLNFKVKKQEENKGNEPNANEKHQNLNSNSLELPQIAIKKEKIPSEREQPKAIGQKNKPIDKNKEIPNVNLVTELTLAGTSKHSNETFKDKQLNENALPIDRANQTISENKPPSRLEKDKEQSIHIPIISEIKQELIRSVSADVKDIFGDLDDDEKDKLKEINPLVYNDLSGKPLLLPTSSATNLLAHGEFITLLSDEEEEEEEELGVFIPNSPQKHADKKAAAPTTEIAKSPNIFNTSLNDSIEDTSKALEVLKNHLNETKSKEQSIANDNIDLDDYTSYEPHSEDEDEFMFSQVLLNDMKAELQDDFKKDLDDDSNDAAHPDNDAAELPIQIKQEPDWEKNSSLLSELDNTSWVISDEEDYDKELETKVSDWSSKIFSQSYNNMSQIYDLDTNITDDEDDDEDDVLEDIGRLEDDIDAITDLYNSINEENEQGQKEEDKEKEGSKIIPEVEAKRVLDKQENESLKPEQQQTDSTVRTMDEREKSPELVATKLDAESPLIRPRLKSFTKCKPVLSSSEDEFENDNREPQKPHRQAEQQPETNNVTPTPLKAVDAEKPPAIRTIPQIISPPSLPKHKGKLRGVSAEPSSPSTTKHKNVPLLTKKLHNIREQIWAEETHKSLKRKWTEKPSIGKKRDKERMKVMKECRKDKLKQLAEKPISSSKDSLKRKSSSSSSSSGETNAKKAKVKVTVNNRGAFLTENQPKAPVPVTATKAKMHETTAFKIPKVIANHKCDETIKEGLKRSNSIDEIKKREPLKRGASLDGGLTTFSQEISKADQILFKKTETKCTNQPNKRTAMLHADGPSAVCKEAVAARALRTTNKITFASMERNITESEKNKNKLNTMCNKRCNKPIENPPSILSSPVRGHSKKKTVRFNDTPIVHYIERVYGARKVAGKDILPLTTHKDRRHMIRRTYPIIDNTDKIITQILCWSDEWLVKRNAAVDAAGDIVYPMPTHFSSFEHYKSIMFPLMKLEFASLLERQYNQTSHIKKYKVNLEYVTTNLDRLMLVTKFNYQNRKEMDSAKYDLVILESKQINTDMFAYLTSTRKAAGSCNTMVFEIVPKNITKEFFCGIHELTVRPVIDNVRVEFGAFNAVYQLEATPLFKKILNPVELLQCRHPAKKKVIYRGFNQLNERQHQVLLNTYSRIIDESSPNVSLIQGPPGTGKSCVITNLALQTMYGDEVRCMDKKILVCAQSNAAVDVIAEKLFDISMRMRPERRFRLIRYGLQEKINPFLHPVTLPHIIQQEQIKKLKATNPEISMENKENLKNQMLQLEAQIADLSKRNIKGTVEEDMLLEKQRQLQLMRNISNQFTRPEDERSIATWFLSNANIVCATLSSCVKLSQFVNYFDICIIDEATQCTEPWTLLPLKFGINSLVLVGDTQQLPATILSKKANELGLGKSMFTRIQNCLDTLPSSAHNSVGTITPNYIISGLQTQYRMHPEICKWPNQYFYRNELIHGRITLEFKSPLVPFSVLNLAYTQNEACHNGKITNNLEAEFVAKLLKALDGFIPNKYNSYGVITPYAQHRATLEHAIRSLGLTNIMVNTIESYQGLEKDVIVISNARTSGVGFLANPQRLNVALTRPKKCLILCGNFKNLEIVPAWRCLLQSARERNLYHEISTNCINNIHTNVIDKIRIKK